MKMKKYLIIFFASLFTLGLSNLFASKEDSNDNFNITSDLSSPDDEEDLFFEDVITEEPIAQEPMMEDTKEIDLNVSIEDEKSDNQTQDVKETENKEVKIEGSVKTEEKKAEKSDDLKADTEFDSDKIDMNE